jgi:secreted PhoX family phosphatase
VAGDNGQLRIYVGRKQANGSPVEKAGLMNGTLHVLDAADPAISTDTAWRAAYPTRTAHPATANQVDWNQPGAAQNTEAAAKGLSLNRIEDGSFDPRHPNDFYFLTTEGGDKTPAPGVGSPSRDGGGLWRLRFADVNHPSKGMRLKLLLDGSEAPYLNKPDNMDIDEHGHLMIQEDPGANEHLARIVAYRIKDGARGVVARFDPKRFTTGGPKFMTNDEESSGILDTEDTFGKRSFLFDAQIHTANGLSDPGTQVQRPTSAARGEVVGPGVQENKLIQAQEREPSGADPLPHWVEGWP